MNLKPIQRAEPLSEQVYRYVREAILSGKLAAGEKIVETKLATELKVSRSPVREAMKLLHTEQLLVEQDGALCVFQPSIDDLYDLYDLRLAVEPVATRRAAEVVGQYLKAHERKSHDTRAKSSGSAKQIASQLTVLEKNLKQTERYLADRDMNGVLEQNASFHEIVWVLCGNTRFARILENASDLIQYYCLLVLNINNQQTNILQEHTEIFEAIQSGDGDRAYEAMSSHIKKDLTVIRRQTKLSS